MLGIREARLAALLAAVLVLASSSVPAASAADTVLVPGRPPLMQSMVDKAVTLWEWLLDVQFTQEQREGIRGSAVEAWEAQDESSIESLLSYVALHDELAQVGAAERALLREVLQAEVLQHLQEQADDESAVWLLELYEAAHTPIAPGTPPLTRQVSDAYAELITFMIGVVIDDESFRADRSFKDKVAAYLVDEYGDMAPESQRSLAEMPLIWAAIQVSWPGLAAGQKERYRAEWSEALAPLVEAMEQALEAAEAAGDSTPQPPAASGPGAPDSDEMTPEEQRAYLAQQQAEGWARLESMRVTGNMMIDQLRTMSNPYYSNNPYRTCC